jgi:hypothetical protein
MTVEEGRADTTAPGRARPWARYHALLAITLASLTFWTFWNYGRPLCHTYADLSCGAFTDHFSHVALARMFTEVGFEIYERPRGELGRPLTVEEDAALPSDLRNRAARGVEGWPADKPYLTSWPQIPSFYPPGDLVMFAPVAVAYSFTDMTFTEANLLTIELLLVYSHVTIFFMLLAARRARRLDATEVLALVVGYFLVIRWTLDGFYDGGWIAPLALTPVFLARRAGFAAVTTFAMSLFAHYRALFLLPWGVRGAVDVLTGRQWRPWTWGKTAMTAATLVMGGLTTATFLIARSAMEAHQRSNPFNPAYDAFDEANLVALAIVAVPAGAVFVWKRAWLDLVTVAWVCALITQLPELYPWDAVALVPWLAAPALSPGERDPVVRGARAGAAILVMSIAFSSPLDAGWFRAVVAQLLA